MHDRSRFNKSSSGDHIWYEYQIHYLIVILYLLLYNSYCYIILNSFYFKEHLLRFNWKYNYFFLLRLITVALLILEISFDLHLNLIKRFES